jgi:hypothetical protein
MKISVTLSPISSARLFLTAAAFALLPAPLCAENEEGEDDVVTDDSVSARDVAATPIQDLNLDRDGIPPLLLEAQLDPYGTKGLRTCRQYGTAINELDNFLGSDFDIIEVEKRKLSVGGVAQSVVGAFIPFRGVIREISGANKHEEELQDAILAGMMRRAFLKGMGLKLGCAYPARPADAATKNRLIKQAEEAKAVEEEEKQRDDD